MTKRVALYLRVSTGQQTTDNQKADLLKAIERHGWQLVGVFEDAGISGAKGRDKRPGLDRLLKGVARRDFDLVAAWSVDRLGRSLQDLVSFLVELREKGLDLYLDRQGLDTSTATGRAMFSMMGIFAELERTLIVERVRAGLARARAEGKTLGRPKVPESVAQAIKSRLATGEGIGRVARDLGVGRSTVWRIKNEAAASA